MYDGTWDGVKCSSSRISTLYPNTDVPIYYSSEFMVVPDPEIGKLLCRWVGRTWESGGATSEGVPLRGHCLPRA